nr:DNA/RNA polymerases superfamily protein [Tanacetum cinerariifolium]
MKEYMTKTREDYGSGIARPNFDKDAKFELKGQFLKELRDNTFSRSENEDANKHIERVLEIVDLFTTPDVTQDQLVLHVFPITLTRTASRWLRNEPAASMDAGIKNQRASIKALEIQIGQMSKVLQERGSGSLPSSTETNSRDHVKSISTSEEAETPSIHRIGSNKYVVSSLQKNDDMSLIELSQATIPFPSRLKEYGDDVKEEIKAKMNEHYSTIVKDALPLKEKDPGSFTLPFTINNMCFDKVLAYLGASVSVMSYSTFTNLGLGKLAPTKLIIELADKTVKHPKGIAETVLVRIDKFVFPIDFIVLDMPEDTKIPLILERPFLSTTHAKVDVFKRKFALRVGNNKIVFKSDSLTSNIIMKVYALGLRERIELDLEARLMGEALILNRSEDPKFGDFIELNNLNELLELRNHEIEDLGPTIKEGEVIDEPKAYIVETRNDDMDTRLVVPNNASLREALLTEAHSSPFSQVKIEHQWASGLLQPLDIPVWKWDEISMDFVIGLPRTQRRHDAIWVVVDRLTKSAHFLPIRKDYSVSRKLGEPGLSSVLPFILRQTVRDDYIGLVEFAYNNSWHASIKCAPFEMLYGRKCRAPICWDQVGEHVIEGPEMIEVTNEKVVVAKEKLKKARTRLKSYADKHRKSLEFQPGDHVFLKVSPARFGIKGKLSPRFIGPFEILDRVGEVSYRLALPPQLSHVHNVFHVSLLRGYKYHPLHVISYPLDQIHADLSYVEEPEAILDR